MYSPFCYQTGGLKDVSKIDIHSLRAGGATRAGVFDRLFKRNGLSAGETVSLRTAKTIVYQRFCIVRPCPGGRENFSHWAKNFLLIFTVRSAVGFFFILWMMIHPSYVFRSLWDL